MGSSVILPAPGQPKTGPDASFVTATTPNLVSFSLSDISPPSPLYVQRDDQLLIQCLSTRTGGDTFVITWRFLEAAPDRPGQPDTPSTADKPVGGTITQTVKVHQTQIVVPQDGNVAQIVQLAEGYLLGITANVVGGGTVRGLSFARAAILRQPGGTQNVAQGLFADYVTRAVGPSWPAGRTIAGSESTGAVVSFQVANPAAGADWTLTVPGTRRFAIQSFAATFTASATVATRNVQIIVDDGANIVWTHSVPTGITAGTVATVVGTGTNAPVGVITTIEPVVLPPGLRLFAGQRVRTLTQNIQAGDQWSAIWFLIEQYIDA